MDSKVVIFGVGRLARSLHYYLSHDSPHDVAAFTVDQDYLEADKVEGLPVAPFETIESTFPPDQYNMIVAVGYRRLNQLRVEKYNGARKKGYRLISYVSSKTTCWEPDRLGDNCIILENNVIQPFARIGSGVIVWCGVHVGGHAKIGDHCYLGSHAVINSGAAIGERSFIGANATIRDGAVVGADCIIGAGACILADTAANEVYVNQSTERYRLDSRHFLRMMDISR